MTDEKAKKLLERVQTSIVEVITKGLEAGTITEDRAKQIAQLVLERLPEDITYEELIRVIPKLDDDFSELSAAVVPIMLEYESKMKKIINERITSLIREQRFNDALHVARKAIEFEKGLS
jgi:hypothetical protein